MSATAYQAGDDDDRVSVTVRWAGRDGSPHRGPARVDPGLRAGAQAVSQVSSHGELTMPPPDHLAGLPQAGLGAGIAAARTVGVVIGGSLMRRHLVSVRLAEREHERSHVGPRWGTGPTERGRPDSTRVRSALAGSHGWQDAGGKETPNNARERAR
ncbi:hypothetical protein GCM10010349_18290 [Streptomyces flavofungini]|nr:hypothetical protein GCM10010349_18290 [Streptomyces flavofungini]